MKECNNQTYKFVRKLVFFNNTLSNIFCSCISHKTVKFGYSDPPKITKQIKSILKSRSKIKKEYCRKGQDPTIFAELSRISSEYYDLLRNSNMSSIYKKAWLLITNTQI